MDLELKSLPQSTRAKLQVRFRNYKSDLSKLKKDLVTFFLLPLIDIIITFEFSNRQEFQQTLQGTELNYLLEVQETWM